MFFWTSMALAERKEIPTAVNPQQAGHPKSKTIPIIKFFTPIYTNIIPWSITAEPEYEHKIKVKEIDSKGKENPAAGVWVDVNDKWSGSTTDSKGEIILKLKKGTHKISLKHLEDYSTYQFQDLSKEITIPSGSSFTGFSYYTPRDISFSIVYKYLDWKTQKEITCLSESEAKSALTGDIKVIISHGYVDPSAEGTYGWAEDSLNLNMGTPSATTSLAALQPHLDPSLLTNDNFGESNIGKDFYIAEIKVPTALVVEIVAMSDGDPSKYFAFLKSYSESGYQVKPLLIALFDQNLAYNIILSKSGLEKCPAK